MLCFQAAQTGKNLLRTQNVSEQNQKHFLCPQQLLRAARGQTGIHLCVQKCVRNNVSSFASTLRMQRNNQREHPKDRRFSCTTFISRLFVSPHILGSLKARLHRRFLRRFKRRFLRRFLWRFQIARVN